MPPAQSQHHYGRADDNPDECDPTGELSRKGDPKDDNSCDNDDPRGEISHVTLLGHGRMRLKSVFHCSRIVDISNDSPRVASYVARGEQRRCSILILLDKNKIGVIRCNRLSLGVSSRDYGSARALGLSVQLRDRAGEYETRSWPFVSGRPARSKLLALICAERARWADRFQSSSAP